MITFQQGFIIFELFARLGILKKKDSMVNRYTLKKFAETLMTVPNAQITMTAPTKYLLGLKKTIYLG